MSKIGGKSSVKTLDNENVLQAVVIVDTFSQNLSPFCDYMPPCLLPLANRPILEYTLECLFSSGVQEAVLFCSTFAEKIKDFLSCKEGRWPGMVISVVISEGCRTLGDAMRDLDTKALIRSDFILLSGNLVSNLELISALEKHKKIQKVDKGAVMTMILKECGKRQKISEDDFAIVTNAKTRRVLFYSKKNRSPTRVDIPMEIILETPDIELRSDLLDTQVAVCSIAVPPLFSDNFDFQTREDFVRGLLVNEEVLSSTIYYYTPPPREYAASVNTWPHYQDITHDVIHRWTYPLVPDKEKFNVYNFRRNNIYLPKQVSLSQGCKLEEDVVIGNGSLIGQNSVITQSVIGYNCKIGKNVTVCSAFIFDNVTIEDDCEVRHSVVGPGCILHSSSKITDGSVLAAKVVIDAGKHISALLLQCQPSGEADPDDKVCSKAYVFRNKCEDDSDSDSGTKEVVTGLRVSQHIEECNDDWESSSESDDEVTRSLSPMPEDTNLFYNEVVDSLVRGYEDRLLCDNLVLEINSSRYAYNVTMSEVNIHVVRALLTLPRPDSNPWQHLASRLKYFMPILTNYIRSETAQQDCMAGIEDVASTHPEIFETVVKIIHWLYDQDILSEEVILDWYNNPSDEIDLISAKRVRQQVSPFINWLKEADEQSSEEEE